MFILPKMIEKEPYSQINECAALIPSTIEEKEFYIRLCIKNNYSKRELERQIASHYYERYMNMV